MSDKDTKSGGRNANFELKGLDATEATSSSFNEEVYRGKELAEASDRAKQMIADQTFVRDSRHEDQAMREDKYREYGIQKERTHLLEKQFSSPQPIPNDPQAREVMQREIDEGAVRNYEKKNQYFRDQIDRQYNQSVDEILKRDRDGQLPEPHHAHDQAHDEEHARGGR